LLLENSFLRRVSSTDFAAKPGIVPRCKQPVEPRGCYEVLMWSEQVAKKDGAQARRVLLTQKRRALAPSSAGP
jgi:hypothetical protein